MSSIDPASDLLAFTAMPDVAAALRSRKERVVERWNEAVKKFLPDADPLTTKQVRNSIPAVLEKIALALESDHAEQTSVLAEVSTAHGIVRLQQKYDVAEVIMEYRLLRRIVIEELFDASGGRLTIVQTVAVDIAVDIALQRGVTSYVEYLNEQLTAASAAEAKYLAFVSHDLRNSLNGTLLMLQFLAKRLQTFPGLSDEAEDVQSTYQSIVQTIEGMDRLLDAERLRKRAVQVKSEPVELSVLANDIIRQHLQRAEGKGLRVENRVPVNAAGHCDRQLLALVLQNLIGNAVKFSEKGVVRVEAVNDPLGWHISVSDDGPGIAPERVHFLFEAFNRGETHGQAGLGLGLTIASHAARLLGSELTVKSEIDVGSSFSMTIPPATVDEASRQH